TISYLLNFEYPAAIMPGLRRQCKKFILLSENSYSLRHLVVKGGYLQVSRHHPRITGCGKNLNQLGLAILSCLIGLFLVVNLPAKSRFGGCD
ncbi:MAG: hypothetical protein U9Q07_14940, partial [Planctomycetota bacterium]|nr:hypothetical protein [Planctomycetota bacterium]